MPDTTYRVVLSLSQEGNLSQKIGDLSSGLERAHGHASRFQHAMTMAGEMGARAMENVGHLLESVADKIMHVAEIGAGAGFAALFGAAAYGVTKLNDELEQTQISLGAIFQAQGFAKSFPDAFKMATDQLNKMKVDVKTLPGDLGQLSAIMSSIATPAAQGGLGPDQIRQMAGQAMLVGRIVLGAQADNAMIAREMANLLSGRAGAHNIMGLRLGLAGDTAKHFNKLAPEERVKEIEAIFDRYKGANEKFAQSFIANWTTLKDNIKYGFLADATAPLFDAVKKTMASVNTWFDNNQEKIKDWAHAFGGHLAYSWDRLIASAERFGPALENIGVRFFDLWDKAIGKAQQLEPLLLRVAKFFETMTLGDVGRGVKDVAELKLMGMGLHAGGSLIHSGMEAATMARLIGGFGGGGATGGPAMLGQLGRGLSFGDLLTSAAVGLEGFTLAVGTAKGAIENLVDPNSKYHDRDVAIVRDIKEHVSDKLVSFADIAVKAATGLLDFNRIADGMMVGMDILSQGFRQLFGDLPLFSKYIPKANVGAQTIEELTRSDQKVPPLPTKEDWMDPWNKLLERDKKKLPGGGGGTNIQKVEIIIKGASDPSRVARLVKSELDKVARNPTRSPGVPNWAGPR